MNVTNGERLTMDHVGALEGAASLVPETPTAIRLHEVARAVKQGLSTNEVGIVGVPCDSCDRAYTVERDW